MPIIPVPSVIPFSKVQLQPVYPGQVILSSKFTYSRQIYNFAYPTWRGRAEIFNSQDDEVVGRIQAFLVAMEGAINEFDLPIFENTIEARAGAITGREVLLDGSLSHSLSALPPDLRVGSFVRFGRYLYCTREVNAAGRSVKLDPQRPIPEGAIMQPAKTIRATGAGAEGAALTMSFDWRGPWNFEFRELP